MTTNQPWLLAESTLHEVQQANYEVAVIPFGATEPHNTHLPYGTDTFEGEAIGKAVCRQAHADGAKVVLLPAIPYGTETNMHRLPLAMNLNPSTLLIVLTDLIESLTGSGIRKVVLINSHGGNDFKPFLRELCTKTEAKIFLCDWFSYDRRPVREYLYTRRRSCWRNGNLARSGILPGSSRSRQRRATARR